MTRIFNALIAVCIATAAFAQEKDSLWNNFPVFYNHPFNTKKQGNLLQVSGSSWIDASSANNILLASIYLKQPLDNDLISTNADRMQVRNVAGAEAWAEAGYYHLAKGFLKRDSLHWFARYGIRDLSGTLYTDDLFRLVGMGNKQFEGDTAFGAPFRFQRTRFDYIELGLIKYFANRSVLSVAVGPARGMRWIRSSVNTLNLVTAEYGTSMFWDVDLQAHFSDGKRSGYDAVNGIGATLSAEYSGLLNENGSYSIGVKNFGAINWKATEWNKKDTFTFEGVYVPSLRDLSDESFEKTADSVENIFMPAKSDFKGWNMLPANIYAEYTMKIRGNKSLNFRFEKNLYSAMRIRFSSALTYFRGNFFGTTQLAFGGYGRFNVNQDLGFKLKKSFVMVRLYGLESWAVPKKAAGMGLALSYIYSF